MKQTYKYVIEIVVPTGYTYVTTQPLTYLAISIATIAFCWYSIHLSKLENQSLYLLYRQEVRNSNIENMNMRNQIANSTNWLFHFSIFHFIFTINRLQVTNFLLRSFVTVMYVSNYLSCRKHFLQESMWQYEKSIHDNQNQIMTITLSFHITQ